MVVLRNFVLLCILTWFHGAFGQQEDIEVKWIDPSAENPTVSEESYYLEAQVITKKKDLKLFILVGDYKLRSYSKQKNNSTYNIIERVRLKADRNKVIIGYEQDEQFYPLDSLTIIKSQAANKDEIPPDLLPASSNFSRQDYAIIISNHEYDNWPILEDRGKNVRMIAEELEESYGFKVQLMENPGLFNFLGDFGNMINYGCNSTDQLFVFIESHGTVFNNTNYIIQSDTETLSQNMKENMLVSYDLLIDMIEDKKCENVLLVMDVLKPTAGDVFQNSYRTYSSQLDGDALKRYSLGTPTKRYISNTQEAYSTENPADSESKLSELLLRALRSYGGNDDVLTLSEILEISKKEQINLEHGSYSRKAARDAEFIFVVK